MAVQLDSRRKGEINMKMTSQILVLKQIDGPTVPLTG